jgi:antitoxin VapB
MTVPQPLQSNPRREAKLFRNNRSQAIRIPADFELPGDRVTIERDGDRLIIEPVRGKTLLEILRGMEPLEPEDQFPDIDSDLPALRDVNL